jgi:uncharacterized protein
LPTDTRIATLDAVRGFAVMGILLLNIVDFAMPGYAYIDPNYYGGAQGANWWTWATVYVLADGKMRGLFTMMFGASTVLIAERAAASDESSAGVHYARMASLFVIGMVHAYLIWAGDILVLYSVCGAVMFVFWRLRARALLAIGIGLLVLKLAIGLGSYVGVGRMEAAAQAPGASTAVVREWRSVRADLAPPPETAADDLKAYRGTWIEAFHARAAFAWIMQTQIALISIPDTLALIAIGMALFKLGFFSGQWSRRRYRQVIVAGLATIPLYIPLVLWIEATRFSPVTLLATEAIQLSLLRPFLSLAWASAVILFMQSGSARWLAERFAATGRMAFSNYLGTSIVATLIFNGYGLGWFGYLERWQLYPLVLAFWIAMLLWSKPWLARFRYGPLEWVWRSLARGKIQTLRKV